MDGACKPLRTDCPQDDAASPTAARDGSFFPFFELPPELREDILSRLVTFATGTQPGLPHIPVYREDRSRLKDSHMMRNYEHYPHYLLLVNKRMYQETMKVWHSCHTFIWHIGWSVRPSESHMARREPPLLRDMLQIRHLVVHIMHIDNSARLEELVLSTLQDMLTSGQLAILEVRMDISSHCPFAFDVFFPDYQPQHPRSERGDWDIRQSCPPRALRMFLDLLGHPELKHASLHIDRLMPGSSSSTWCPFHDYISDTEPTGWGVPIRWRDFRADLPPRPDDLLPPATHR